MSGTLQRFDIATLPATPWKNGGGSTREIACWPPGAGFDAFEWRVSIATIAASGPFSVFPDVDRTIMLLQGDGVRLQGAGVDHQLDTPHQPFEFSGDVAVDCTLLGGVSTDLNLMSRRGRGRPVMLVLKRSASWRASFALVMVLEGVWSVNGRRLTPGQGCWWAGTEHTVVVATKDPDARLVVLR